MSRAGVSEPLTPRVLRDWPLPVPDGGKHARGSVLVIGGARAAVGAVLLSGVAALRAGAGVLRMAVAGSGAAGLGTSGSGDVLAGVVAGLLARGAEPDQAACWATYTHAAAGQRLAARVGRIGFLARDLVDEVPRVLMELAS